MSNIFNIIPGGKPDSDPVEKLYHDIHALIEAVAISPVALVGVLELVKGDVMAGLREE